MIKQDTKQDKVSIADQLITVADSIIDASNTLQRLTSHIEVSHNQMDHLKALSHQLTETQAGILKVALSLVLNHQDKPY
jgi:hypothetical protein